MLANSPVPVLLISGTIGVGKTTVLNELHDLLCTADVAHTCIDADALALSWPRRSEFNRLAMLDNLASLWTNARRAGAQRCVIATVVERPENLNDFRDAIPNAELVLVQLIASETTRAARLRQREVGSSLEWHLQRTSELQQILDQADLAVLRIENDGRPPRDVALEVLSQAKWPGG
jgi:cytidylate kinase